MVSDGHKPIRVLPSAGLIASADTHLAFGKKMRRLFRQLFGKPQKDLVPFHDFATQTTIRIPSAELSPGAVLIQIEGDSVPVYADSAALRIGEYQHDALSDGAVEAIREFMLEFTDVCSRSYDQWEDGFRRDRNPDREVAGWLHLSRILRVMSDRYRYNLPQRDECFRILVACYTGGRDTVRDRSDPILLPVAQVEEMARFFYEGGYQ